MINVGAHGCAPARGVTPLLLLVFCLGCPQRPAELPAGLTPVVHPDLSSIEDVAREQLEERRSALDAALARRDTSKQAAAFGDMGELYHAYELSEAAAACYLNAEKLDPESFLWPYLLGVLQQETGDLEAAAASLERALEKRPDDRPARRRLGEIQLALGDAPAAREQFQALLDGGTPEDAFAGAAYFGLGRAAAANGDAEQAVQHLQRTLELQPAAGIVRYPLAQTLRGLGRDDEARELLAAKGSGEVLSPDRLMDRLRSLAISSGAHLNRGNQALMSDRLDAAETAFRNAIEADPKSTAARRNLALVLARKGLFDGAIAELKAAVETDPDDVWIHVDLGNAQLGKGQSETAVRSLERAVELDPTLVQARFNLANALIGLERWSDARPHLEATLELEPGHTRARYQLAMANHHSSDSTAAIRELRALLEDEPTFLAARTGLATILTEAKRAPEAMAVYRQGLDLDLPAAEEIELLNALANLAWRSRQRQPALAYWRRVTDIDPESSTAWTNLANALQLSGQREEAREYFARAVELDPSNATAWLSEARLWILASEFQAARQRLEAALTAVPDDAGLNDTLARLLATCPIAEIRDGRRAMALAQKAYAIDGTIAHAETFGMALAELGRFEEAIRWQRSVINEAARIGEQSKMRQLVTTLRRYESRQPIRMSAKP